MTTDKRRGRPPRNGPDDGDDLERLLASAGADDVLQTYRRDAAAGKLVYLEQLEPGQLTGEGIREFVSRRYGGGDYKVRLRNRTSGAYGMTRSFSVAGAPKAFARDVPLDAAAAASSAATDAAGNNSTVKIVERIALALAIPFATAAGGFLAKKLLERPPVDPLLQELIRALNRKDHGGSLDSLELLKLLNQAETRGQQLGERIGQLAAAAAEREPGGDDDGEGWQSAIVNAITPLEGIANRYFDLEEKKLNRARPPLALVPNTIAAAAPAAGASTSSAPSAPAIDAGDPLIQVLGQIPLMARRFLAAAAENGDDPAVYVPLVLTKLPDATYQQFVALIDRPDFVEKMILVVPKWGERREWFAQLYDGLRAAIHAEDDPAAAPPADDATAAPTSELAS